MPNPLQYIATLGEEQFPKFVKLGFREIRFDSDCFFLDHDHTPDTFIVKQMLLSKFHSTGAGVKRLFKIIPQFFFTNQISHQLKKIPY